jgi:hypothetical protein
MTPPNVLNDVRSGKRAAGVSGPPAGNFRCVSADFTATASTTDLHLPDVKIVRTRPAWNRPLSMQKRGKINA